MAVIRWCLGVLGLMVTISTGVSAAALLLTGEIAVAIVAGLLAWGGYALMLRMR